MHRTAIRADGCLPLGDAAQRLGFTPGALVDVIVTSAGSLILRLDDTPVLDVPYSKPLPNKTPRVALSDVGRLPSLPVEPVAGHTDRTPRVGSERGERSAAARLGITYEAYRDQLEAGNRWCSRCRQFQPRTDFIVRPERPGGLSSECVESNRTASREYQRQKRRSA